ncbi:long-chain-fatty-acid--CoA ligase 4-like protein [Leptotrombidium deliense]|uniref:long-chain-fatty-acid--CoA ligase n=1 Tax=Leptotrombidium deliense TaxID=299467 RepID=A0A443SRU0_9ACAR|nr:long-chain-fatty-acid--CoA ligase 4-like protein [Leptotrombidium deliense]
MEFLKSTIYLYDIVTFPVYYAIQRPWIKKRKANKVRAIAEQSDKGTLWRSVAEVNPSLADDCSTVDAYFSKMVMSYGSRKCLGFREIMHEEMERQNDGKVFKKRILSPNYKWFTYSQIDKRIDDVVKGFLLNSVKPKDKVAIFADTRSEWMISFLALMRMGAIAGTLYATLGDEGIIHGINQLECECIVTTSELLPKLVKNLAKTPSLKKVIIIEDSFARRKSGEINTNELKSEEVEIITFRDLELAGSQGSPELQGKSPSPDDLAVIMFTSGSTGVPKGVLISHRNIMAHQRGMYFLEKDWTFDKINNSYVAYLPLAHILELTSELFALSLGVSIGYSSVLTLSDKSTGIKAGSLGDVTVLKPAMMGGVPLVLDKVRKGITDQVKGKGDFVKNLFEFAVDYRNYWFEKGFTTPILDFLLFRKVRAGFGGKVDIFFSGGAPLSPETQSFMRACLGVKMLCGYGATETTGGVIVTDLNHTTLGKVGAPIPGTRVKLIAWEEGNYYPTDKPNPRGEICVGGDCVALGYFKNDEATKEAFYEEGGISWFKTGDIGEVFPDGTFKIVDRRKDLIKLQHGEYVSLGKVSALFVKSIVLPKNQKTSLKPCSRYVINNQLLGHKFVTL